MQGHRKLTMICCAAVLTLGLAACGGGGSDDDTAMVCPAGQIGTYPDCMDPPTPYETASAAIAAATTAEAAQAAYDAVKDDVTAAQGEMLQDAVDARIMAIKTAARVADQKMDLADAAGMIDTSDLSDADAITAANAAIAMLQAALDAADDVSDADKAMYQAQLDAAEMAVREAQTGLDTAGRMMAQRTAISDAVTAARTAVGMVDDDATDAEVKAADDAVAALKTAIDGAADLPEGDTDVASAQGTLDTLQGQLASAKTSRTAAIAAKQTADDMAMAATAAKLHAGIYAPAADATGTETSDVHAAYNNGDTAIEVTIGTGSAAGTAVTLSEDKKTMVAVNHGWAGKRYADPAGGDSYEAVVYSNIEAPTMGRKFGHAEPGTGATRDFEYTLDADGYLTAAEADGVDGSDDAFVAARIAFTGVTRTVGTETFKKDDPDLTVVKVPGSYHGVSGTYRCTPATGTTCSATVASKGFTLGAGTWVFDPSDSNVRVMDAADTAYSSYGWWLYKSENGKTFTASAFHDFKGTPARAVSIGTLTAGTATYSGGAAGKYALSSTTGGTNDAGHFTARAMLEANFEDDEITGTIDNFMGADGMSRDWSVELKKSTIGAAGLINSTGLDGGAANQTVWTIDGTDAKPSGEWSGNLREQGTDGVPEAATGTFHTLYGTAGSMVGAFGANKQ